MKHNKSSQRGKESHRFLIDKQEQLGHLLEEMESPEEEILVSFVGEELAKNV